MNTGDAIRSLRSKPAYESLLWDSYLNEDLADAARRFEASAEFGEVKRLLSGRIVGGTILDLGAGNGIASVAFARNGAKRVFALEPDEDSDVGRGAIIRQANGLPIDILNGFGETIPLGDSSVDVVYARQVVHHVSSPRKVASECARVLREGGMLIACREHVVDDEAQRRAFLDSHPVHLLTNGENAWPLDVYVDAFSSSGLKLSSVLGPWDSVINSYPATRTYAELESYARRLLVRRFGAIGRFLTFVPGVELLVWRRVKRPVPGRLYSFVAVKRE